MATIGNLLVKITANVEGLKKGLNDAEGLVGKAKSKFGGLGGAIKGGLVAGAAAGVVAVGALGAGMVAVAADSVSAAAAMDQQVSNIAAVMGKAKDEVGPLKDLIFDLSLNPNLTVDATQAADAIEMLAKNGLSMEQIVNGAAESTVQLANATGADFSTAADVATDVMALFNIEAENMGTAVDGITGVTTNSKFGIDDYALALGNAGGVAAGMGVDLGDLNAVLVGTSSSFAAGAEAGTSFKTFLQRMAQPTGEMQTLMDELGISLFDAQGQMRPMGEVVGQLHTAMSGMTEAQKANVAATLGGADAARMVIALSQMSQSEYDALNEKVNAQGQAAQSAATRVDSLQGAWAIFLGIIDAIKLQIGDALLPAIKLAVEQFSQFASAAGPVIVEYVSIFGDYLAGTLMPLLLSWAEWLFNEGIPMFWQFAQPILEQVVPALMTLGVWVMNMAITAWPLLQAAIGFVIDNFNIIGPILAAVGIAILAISSPITLIVGLIILLAMAWANNWGGIQEKTQAVIDFIWPYIQMGIEFIKTAINEGLTLIQQWWDEHGENLMLIIRTAWDWISTNVQTKITMVQTIITTVATAIQQFWDTWGQTIMTLAQLTWENIKTIVNAAMDIIGFIIDAAAALIKGDWEAFGEALMSIWRTAWDTIKTLLGNAKTAIMAIINTLVQLATQKFEAWKTSATEKITALKTAVSEKITAMKEAVVTTVTGLKDTVSGLWDTFTTGLKTTWSSAWESIKSTIDGIAGEIKDIIQGIIDAINSIPVLPDISNPFSTSSINSDFTPNNVGVQPQTNLMTNSNSQPQTVQYNLYYNGSAPGDVRRDFGMLQATAGRP